MRLKLTIYLSEGFTNSDFRCNKPPVHKGSAFSNYQYVFQHS